MKTNKMCQAITRSLGLGLGLGLVGLHAAHAGENIVVDSTADQAQAGLTTLREAINLANLNPGSVIEFDDNVFASPQTITLQNGELQLIASTTISGPGADLLTLDGDQQSRILTIDSGTQDQAVTISGITFTRGNGTSTIENNRGGCIFTFDNLTLSDSVVTDCAASSNGGGIFSRFGTLNIERSTISHNSSGTKGGGLYRRGGDADFINSTFNGNSAQEGGGVYLTQAGAAFINATISGNQSNQGAGIRLESGSPRTVIKHSTIVNNTGVGIDLRNAEMHNSVIAGNTEGDCVFLITGSDNQNNFDSDGSCDVEATNHTTVADPLLGPLTALNSTTLVHTPLTDSPLIDSGDGTLCLAKDQRGIPRPLDGDGDGVAACDVGAIEIDLELIFYDGFD